VRLLLDTHTFLWWLNDDPKLRAAAREAIADPVGCAAIANSPESL
jgi:PIN domain nuclease of toxin-antitoxin system